jgi:hypothetical protein
MSATKRLRLSRTNSGARVHTHWHTPYPKDATRDRRKNSATEDPAVHDYTYIQYICIRYNLSKLTWTNSATSCTTVRLACAATAGRRSPVAYLISSIGGFYIFRPFLSCGGVCITRSLNLHRRRHIYICIAYDRQSQLTILRLQCACVQVTHAFT